MLLFSFFIYWRGFFGWLVIVFYKLKPGEGEWRGLDVPLWWSFYKLKPGGLVFPLRLSFYKVWAGFFFIGWSFSLQDSLCRTFFLPWVAGMAKYKASGPARDFDFEGDPWVLLLSAAGFGAGKLSGVNHFSPMWIWTMMSSEKKLQIHQGTQDQNEA